jgi:hypothetical protein
MLIIHSRSVGPVVPEVSMRGTVRDNDRINWIASALRDSNELQKRSLRRPLPRLALGRCDRLHWWSGQS